MKCSAVVALVVLAACGDDASAVKDAGPCVEAWSCETWTTDGVSNNGTRTCTDLNACGTTNMKPVEAATLPALDPEFYECNVEPVVTRGCSMLGCHGTETGRGYRLYARGRHRISGVVLTEPGCSNPGAMSDSSTCIGNIECKCWSLKQLPQERRRSFDSARGFALADDGTTLTDLTQSQLLKQPQTGGGFPHQGVFLWSAGDADYNNVKMWLEGAQRGSVCNSMN